MTTRFTTTIHAPPRKRDANIIIQDGHMLSISAGARLCLVSFAFGLALAAVRPITGQTINGEPVRDLLTRAAPLSAQDIQRVLEASREAIAGKTFRFTPVAGTPGAAHQMGTDGRLQFVRNEILDQAARTPTTTIRFGRHWHR